MCEYCGCQEIEAIAELTAEHDELRNLGRMLTDAADVDDLPTVRSVATAMRTLLGPHTAIEERALFPALIADFADQLAVLTNEHDSIDARLDALAGRDLAADTVLTVCRHVVADLFEHILKEQDGVFPAALSRLTTAEWNAVDAARKAVRTSTATRR